MVAYYVRNGTGLAALAATFAICPAQAFASEAQVAPTAITQTSTTNPNLNEWSLVNLTATDVASANGAAGIKVAVLDGYTDCRHADLSGRCSTYIINGGTYRYYSNHGSHTAGTVAGKQFGVGTSATVVNYAVFDDAGFVATGTKLSDVWRHAYSQGARISSMSFGCSKMALCFTANQIMTMADGTRPMLYVKAAGNDGANLVNESIGVASSTATTALNRTLLVGSVDANGVISTFSNRPGEACLLPSGTSGCPNNLKWKNHFLVAPGEVIYATLPGSSYGYMSGTSMATPIVAGVAALLQQRWPSLLKTPDTLAKILLTTATDLGAPGVDAVYGYGLLNAAKAFQANGKVNMVSSSGSTTTMSGTTSSSSPMMSKLASALADLPVYDQFGRDFPLAETGALTVTPTLLSARQALGRRALASAENSEWAAAFFADEPQARSYAMFGSPMEIPGSVFALDRSTRMGLDMPFKGGVAQLRLTGSSDPRSDFANDPTMRPLAYFQSTSLLNGALIGNALISMPGNARLMAYGIVTSGAVDIQARESLLDIRVTDAGPLPRALAAEPVKRKQTGMGVGYWMRPTERTTLGINASVMSQTGGFYSLTSDLENFDNPTRMYNLGAAAIRKFGSWNVSLSGEVTHLRMSNRADAALSFTPTTLVSAEIAVSKTGVAFSGDGASDDLTISLALPPRGIAGGLRASYMKPTADGMELEAASHYVPFSALGTEPMRLEAAYRVSSGSGWTVSLSGGVNLGEAAGLAPAEGAATFKLRL